MNQNFHSSDFSNLTEAVLGFVRYARQEGLKVGVKESQEALLAARTGVLDARSTLAYALKALFCTAQEETVLFDTLFEQFWKQEKPASNSKASQPVTSKILKKSTTPLALMDFGDTKEKDKKESKTTAGANAKEQLRQTDFSKVAAIDHEVLEELALHLWKQMSKRLKRKLKKSERQGKIDLRQTIHASIAYGGEPLTLRKKKRVARKQRLVVLLDVSGSMDKYSFFLLRFVWTLRAYFENIEVFIFSTRLIRITDYLAAHDLSQTLFVLSHQANNWSSGTKIGACFQHFNEVYAKKVLSGKSTTIILSDGLDTGSPNLLATEVKKIKRRTRRLIWLNPLKGMQGYEPIQKGMRAALPNVDVFSTAHNLDSLLQLEKYLLQV